MVNTDYSQYQIRPVSLTTAAIQRKLVGTVKVDFGNRDFSRIIPDISFGYLTVTKEKLFNCLKPQIVSLRCLVAFFSGMLDSV